MNHIKTYALAFRGNNKINMPLKCSSGALLDVSHVTYV